jgi:hypothetical protein
VDGKATKWRAVYKNGKWVEQMPEKAAAKPKKTTRRRAAKGA